jgi:hypothetical protein
MGLLKRRHNTRIDSMGRTTYPRLGIMAERALYEEKLTDYKGYSAKRRKLFFWVE